MNSVQNPVLMIGWEYPPHNSGGLGVACEGMTLALAEAGERLYFTLPYPVATPLSHMQIVDCSSPDWSDQSAQTLAGVYGAPFLVPTTHHPTTKYELATLPQSQLEYQVGQYADQVTSKLNTLAPAMGTHAHDWMSFPAAMNVKAATGQPFIAHVHSTEFDRIPNGMGSPYIHQTEFEGLTAADHIIAVSDFTKRLIVQKYQIDPAKISVIHNGILPIEVNKTARHHFAADRPVIVFMGRLTMQKGAEYFIRLASKIVEKAPEALFILAGDGDQYRSLLLSSAGSGLSSHLLFTGFVRDKDRESLLDRADVFVMPSLSEPFGLVALEAAQRQTPVIISKTAGVAEVMPSATVVDFWDTELMTSHILELIEKPATAAAQVQAQSADLEQLSWHGAAEKISQLYRRVFLGS